MYETHEQWSGMTRENFFREFRAFQEQRTATLDKITFVGQELLTISKNFAQTDAEVVQTSARGGLDLNLMINEQKRGYAQAQTDEERDAYSQEADRIRDAMRQQGYDETEIMQKTDPAMSEDQVMARAWDETRKWAEADPKGFGLMFAGRPLVQGAIANIEAARNTYNEARKGEIVKVIVDYAKGYTNFYTDLGYKLAESASNPGETVDKLTHSPAQAKTEFIASLASGLIFGRHMKKEHHGEGGSGGRKPGAGGGTGETVTRTQRELDSLATDPAIGNKITPKTIAEREVGLGLEAKGEVSGLVRDPSGKAEFIDSSGQKWDVKAYNSNFVPKKGGYTLNKSMDSINKSLSEGENVIVDTRNLSSSHLTELTNEVAKQGLGDRVKFWP